jgi:hypothetical protein
VGFAANSAQHLVRVHIRVHIRIRSPHPQSAVRVNYPTMDSPTTPCALTPHQAIMKCPWQWRMPFLDEKLASRKRKAGDGYFYDPVDPSFVDHLLPGHAKKFCSEADERSEVQREIQRLATRKEQLHAASMLYDALLLVADKDHRAGADASGDAQVDAQALVDGLLRAEDEDAALLLASPKSVADSAPPSEDEDEDDGGADEHALALALVSDNLQDELFAEDGALLDFQPHARD